MPKSTLPQSAKLTAPSGRGQQARSVGASIARPLPPEKSVKNLKENGFLHSPFDYAQGSVEMTRTLINGFKI